MKKVVNRTREWREARGYTLERLAEMMDVSPSTVSKLETDKMELTTSYLESFAHALDVDIEELVARPSTTDRDKAILRVIKKLKLPEQEVLLKTLEAMILAQDDPPVPPAEPNRPGQGPKPTH